MRSHPPSSPSDRPAASSRAASRPQIATRAPPRKSSRAVASPMPDEPPVTTAMRSSSPKESMQATLTRADLGCRGGLRLRRRLFDGVELRLRFLLEHATHPRKPGVMLVEKLARSCRRRHILQHDSILLEHRPVKALKLRSVHELPDIPHPAFALAGAPEEDNAVIFIDRRNEAGDAKVAARSGARAIRNGEAKPDRTCVAELRPVEVHVPL